MYHFRLILIFISVIFIDQLTKWWAISQDIVIFNPGVSFGLLVDQGRGVQLIVIGLTMVVLAWICKDDWHRVHIPFTAVIGASVSNLLDRFRLGGVVDFLPVPVLNVSNNLADWIIFGGLLWIMVVQWRRTSS